MEALSQQDIHRAMTLLPQARVANPTVAEILKDFILFNSQVSLLFSVIQPTFLSLTEDMLKEFLTKRQVSDMDEHVLFHRVLDWAIHQICSDIVPMTRIAGETLYVIESFRRQQVPQYSIHRYGTVDLNGRVAIPVSLIRKQIQSIIPLVRFEHVQQEFLNQWMDQALISDRDVKRVNTRPCRMLRYDFVSSDNLSPTSFMYANSVWCIDVTSTDNELLLHLTRQGNEAIDSHVSLQVQQDHISAIVSWPIGTHRTFVHALPRNMTCNASLSICMDENYDCFIQAKLVELQQSEQAISMMNFTLPQILDHREQFVHLDNMYRTSHHLDRQFFEDPLFPIWLRDKKQKWSQQRTSRKHEPEKERYCLCRAEWDDNETDMIQCDMCQVWYHFACVGINPQDGTITESYFCPLCDRKRGNTEKHKKWTKEQDQKLLVLCSKKNKNWPAIASSLGRTSKQCRDRWMDHVDPSINRSEWTAQEDELIMKLKEEIGNAWCKMTDKIKGRSANMIRNRYRSLMNGRKSNTLKS